MSVIARGLTPGRGELHGTQEGFTRGILFQPVTRRSRVGGVEPMSLNPLKGKRSLRH